LFAALLSIPGDNRYPLPEMTPQRRKERTLAALLDQAKQLAVRRPILMVFEDLHWIDPTSLEFMGLMVPHSIRQHLARFGMVPGLLETIHRVPIGKNHPIIHAADGRSKVIQSLNLISPQARLVAR